MEYRYVFFHRDPMTNYSTRDAQISHFFPTLFNAIGTQCLQIRNVAMCFEVGGGGEVR